MKKMFLIAAIVAAACGAIIAAPSKDAKYIGSDKCKNCHSSEHKGWAKTAHSRAYDLLVNVDQQKNAACLSCHTTGYGKGGFTDETATPGLKSVQCESCHGPASEHNGDATKIVRVPSASVCASCHQKENIHPMGG